MLMLQLLNFSGVTDRSDLRSGWYSAKTVWNEMFPADSPFRDLAGSHGSKVGQLTNSKFATISAQMRDGDNSNLGSIRATVGEDATIETCPFDLSESMLLSRFSKRMNFSAAVLNETDSLPSKLNTADILSRISDAMNSVKPVFESVGTSSTAESAYRILFPNVQSVVGPIRIEAPNAEAYGEGFGLGMSIAAKMTE